MELLKGHKQSRNGAEPPPSALMGYFSCTMVSFTVLAGVNAQKRALLVFNNADFVCCSKLRNEEVPGLIDLTSAADGRLGGMETDACLKILFIFRVNVLGR